MSDLLMKMPVPFEPKRKNRFILRFPSSLGIQEWYVSTAKRPSAKIGSVEIPFLNTSTYVAGRFLWDEVTVNFRDPIGPSAMQALMEWFRLHAESVTGRMGYASGYKVDVELDMLDPGGVVIERWRMEGCFITTLSGGDLNYSQEELATIDITLRPDRCILIF